MAQDIREMFKNDKKLSDGKMPEGHEKRFLNKLEKANPRENRKSSFPILKIAASVLILLGLAYGGFKFLTPQQNEPILEQNQELAELKTLGDVSPELKKVEDYYMANINLELSNMDVNEDNKELFDGYILKLEELNKEYKRLSKELTESGPNELTVNALIDNLRLRLNLLQRLRQQLRDLQEVDSEGTKINV